MLEKELSQINAHLMFAGLNEDSPTVKAFMKISHTVQVIDNLMQEIRDESQDRIDELDKMEKEVERLSVLFGDMIKFLPVDKVDEFKEKLRC